jgi:seryl-tRNA(Sec) selenium transferase
MERSALGTLGLSLEEFLQKNNLKESTTAGEILSLIEDQLKETKTRADIFREAIQVNSPIQVSLPASSKSKSNTENRSDRLEPEQVRALREKYRKYAYISDVLNLSQAARSEGINPQTFTKIIKGESYPIDDAHGQPLTPEELKAAKSTTPLLKK